MRIYECKAVGGGCRLADARCQVTFDLFILCIFVSSQLIAKVAKSEASGDYLAVQLKGTT